MLDMLATREKGDKQEEEDILCSTGSYVISFVSAVQVGHPPFHSGTASCEAGSEAERQAYFQQMLDILATREKEHKEGEEDTICSTGSDVISFVSAVQVVR
jgi:hypothetical protein